MTYVNGLAEISGANPASGTYRYYSTDHLGSIRSVRAEDKSSLASFEYGPYGALHSSSGSLDLNIQAALGAFEDESHLALAAEGWPTAQLSAGHRWDPDVQQYFAPYRYYSPTTARWLTRDPLGMIDGPNVYVYVGSNPAVRTDPLGGAAGPIQEYRRPNRGPIFDGTPSWWRKHLWRGACIACAVGLLGLEGVSMLVNGLSSTAMDEFPCDEIQNNRVLRSSCAACTFPYHIPDWILEAFGIHGMPPFIDMARKYAFRIK